MNFQDLIDNITPEIYENLKRAVELGRWPNGEKLSDEEKANCLQAVIAYDQKHHSETDRVGYIDRGHKAEGEVCGDDDKDQNQTDTLKWLH